MIWYLESPERFRHERQQLELLAARAPWLLITKWHVDADLRLTVDAEIEHGGRTWPISLRFPNHFPFSPPVVMPRDDTERWSLHQYGPGGELCLEYGADNWDRTISGRMMLESAHRLLAGESPTPDGPAGRLPSRHSTTLGQVLRGSRWRLVLTAFSQGFLNAIPVGTVLHGQGTVSFREEMVLYTIRSWGSDPECADPTHPVSLRQENHDRPVMFVRLPDGEAWPRTDVSENFRADLAANGAEVPPAGCVVLVARGKLRRGYSAWDQTVQSIDVVSADPSGRRLDADHGSLSSRRVAVVGCGSLGSKVAVSLARSGVGNFLLVDDDILLPENLVRHELDWREVGTHKTQSVARRIDLVNPSATVVTRQHRLGGQEASGSVETLMTALAECDLIVDASATPEVFNYLSAATEVGKTSMIWAEVYGGGIGGLVARHRPGKEPEPALMRRAIENWCAEHALPIERHPSHYESGAGTSTMVADDADVAVIAAHAARFAIDALIPREPSIFPHSAYFVGLGPGWIFSQPFETHPVNVGAPSESDRPPNLDAEEAADERARVVRIFLGTANGIAAS
ncbi:ThiF family adenylyltransferase [Aureimonas psammosilenae]|uniref:ThiF family adenylyltransferase n=1 Tax=Aureimonas psammosilenae TaxID=2495496 RepID=UPI001260BB14|nr:ThiF family adenylyltransferase [Aureimonas psammosilenae]